MWTIPVSTMPSNSLSSWMPSTCSRLWHACTHIYNQREFHMFFSAQEFFTATTRHTHMFLAYNVDRCEHVPREVWLGVWHGSIISPYTTCLYAYTRFWSTSRCRSSQPDGHNRWWDAVWPTDNSVVFLVNFISNRIDVGHDLLHR